jgi:hypothetical protein
MPPPADAVGVRGREGRIRVWEQSKVKEVKEEG